MSRVKFRPFSPKSLHSQLFLVWIVLSGRARVCEIQEPIVLWFVIINGCNKRIITIVPFCFEMPPRLPRACICCLRARIKDAAYLSGTFFFFPMRMCKDRARVSFARTTLTLQKFLRTLKEEEEERKKAIFFFLFIRRASPHIFAGADWTTRY